MSAQKPPSLNPDPQKQRIKGQQGTHSETMGNCKQPLFLKAICLTPTDANLDLDFSPEDGVILYHPAPGPLAPAHCAFQGSLYWLRLPHILLALSGLHSPRLAAEASGLNRNDDLSTPTNGICLSPSPKSNLVLRNQTGVQAKGRNRRIGAACHG